MTNYEKIKEMTISELKMFLCSISGCAGCRWGTAYGCALKKWLESEVEHE